MKYFHKHEASRFNSAFQRLGVDARRSSPWRGAMDSNGGEGGTL